MNLSIYRVENYSIRNLSNVGLQQFLNLHTKILYVPKEMESMVVGSHYFRSYLVCEYIPCFHFQKYMFILVSQETPNELL